MSFKKVVKKHNKIAKRIHKYSNPVTGLSNLAGKVIGGKAGRVVSRGGAAAATGGMSEAVRMFKKLIKKKNTNVGKASKQKRRDRIDKREGSPDQKVTDRRAKIDAKDNARFAKNDTARERVNKKISKQNERLGRNDAGYKSQAEIDSPRRTGTPGGRRGQGGGAAARRRALKAKKAGN